MNDYLTKCIKAEYPNIDEYHLKFILEDVIAYLEYINNHEDPVWALPLDEKLKVKTLNNIRDQIANDIIEQDHGRAYVYKEDQNKSQFQQGVLAAIHLIEHRVHCICG